MADDMHDDATTDLDHWNYRLIQHYEPTTGEFWVGVHEVYYRGEQLWSYTVDAVDVMGADEREAAASWRLMGEAFDKPTLTDSDFPFYNRLGNAPDAEQLKGKAEPGHTGSPVKPKDPDP
jgi:hypothetical protein